MSLHESTNTPRIAPALVARLAAAALVSSISVVACRRDGQPRERDPRAVAAAATTAPSREASAGGEIVSASTSNPQTSTVRWITDANALSLVTSINAREMAAADVELENWHIDTARAFAASMAREHAELQHSIDSIAGRLNLTPVSPALANRWTSAMQAQIDTVRRAGENGLDLAFVRQQANSHQLMSEYLSELAAVVERPELQAFLENGASKASSQAQRARSLQPLVAATDSARRDAARRRRTSP